jgi:hypothetical protein
MQAPTLVTPQSTAHPLDAKKVKGAPAAETEKDLVMTDSQVAYQSMLETRLKDAQTTRDRLWPEFNDKSYLTYYEENEKISNTYVEAKRNDDDVKLASGTIESKLNTLLSHIDNLNLTPEVLAFDKDDEMLRDLGTAFTDILDRVAEHDGGTDGGDQEKRPLRQKELLKQGTVFIQDKWCTKKRAQKVLKKKFDGKFNFNAWDTAWKTHYEGPERVLLYGPNVYLGDITQFAMEDQPYIFTVETMSYDVAKTLFGSFENWTYVKAGRIPASAANTASGTAGGRTIFDGKFRLTRLNDTQVEVIKYQDPVRDEFQIMINGIMMLPIGFPLSAVTPGGKINVVKQVLFPINPQFAYGKSFVSSGDVYALSKQLDEMLRLFVLKTRKSVTPPYINVSGKIISRRVLAPGNISQGIPPGALQPIGTESQGVTQGEYQIYKEILERIESSTVGPAFQGQYGGSNTTATEVIEVQRQARLSLGVMITGCTLLEVKLTYLRLPIVIANYFDPIEEIMGEDGVAKKKYKTLSKEANIEGAGNGIRRIIPTDGERPTKVDVRSLEIQDEDADGYPSQRIYLDVKALRNFEVRWRVVVKPQERDKSAYEKLMFREVFADAVALYNMGSVPNVGGLESMFANAHGIDRNKLFGRAEDLQVPMDPSLAGQKSGGGMPPTSGAPTASPGMTSQVGAGG